MSEAYVLVGSSEGRSGEVAEFLAHLPGVTLVHTVRFGHFDVICRIEAPTHAEIQALLANRVRFHEGVERVEELGDREDAAATLHALHEATSA